MKSMRLAGTAILFLAASPVAAQEMMTASAAQAFVAGKQFSYSCFDGTEGSGRIHANGSAVGTIRPSGRGDLRYVRLPAGTLFIQNDRVCASLRGLPFQPCFNLVKTGETSFRGSVAGLGFMYCEFERGSRAQWARSRAPGGTLRGSIMAGSGPSAP